MTGLGQRRATRNLGLCLALATLVVAAGTGCGNDGNVGVTFPPTPKQIEDGVSGVVQMPNGQFSSAGSWWEWPATLNLVTRAFAVRNPNVSPVGAGVLVAISHIDPLDAADGRIDGPLLIDQTQTDEQGRYQIIDAALDDVDQCRLMLAVGSGDQLTRAFVTSHSTNDDESLDAVSEATVRVVLDRLTKAPPVQLCDFSTDDLRNIYQAVSLAAYTARGTTVAQINADAFAKAMRNAGVQKAVAQATGSTVAN